MTIVLQLKGISYSPLELGCVEAVDGGCTTCATTLRTVGTEAVPLATRLTRSLAVETCV